MIQSVSKHGMGRCFLTLLTISCLALRVISSSVAEDVSWELESPDERAALPSYQVIPAAPAASLTPSRVADRQSHISGEWYRSHGNHAGNRYSPLHQIHAGNIHRLEMAWTYHSKDGKGNIQCNPIAVDGIIYAPTVGHHVVAIEGLSGKEKWRFKPEGQPAFRGLTYWDKATDQVTRLLFNAGPWLYALDPRTGQPIEHFGEGGRIRTGHFRVAPAIHNDLIAIAGYEGDAFAYDLISGEKKWTFHTRPQPGEWGHETWSELESGANCWSGTALDAQRGIFYLTTGSPKPNFIGNRHLGDNLFSNCVIALDVKTGERIWHFQEIRHDIWDLDLPAPPILVSIKREGMQVEAVATVSKLGNTLLLDRVSGQPVFPFRLRKAPVSVLHGERTSAYQPDLQWPQPFARQHFHQGQLTNISPQARQAVLDQLEPDEMGVRSNTGWFAPFAAGSPTALFGIHGGAEWTGASFDPESGWLYVTSNELPWFPTVSRVPAQYGQTTEPDTLGRKIYESHCLSCHGLHREGQGVNPPLVMIGTRLKERDMRSLLQKGRNLMPAAVGLDQSATAALMDYLMYRDSDAMGIPESKLKGPVYTFNGYPKLLDHEGYPGCKPPWGTLNCVDLNTGILRWQVPLGEHAALTERGLSPTGTENFGGAMVTAGGLVFAAGTRDQKIWPLTKGLARSCGRIACHLEVTLHLPPMKSMESSSLSSRPRAGVNWEARREMPMWPSR